MRVRVKWDIPTYDRVYLPTEVLVPYDTLDISDYLSDSYGYAVKKFVIM